MVMGFLEEPRWKRVGVMDGGVSSAGVVVSSSGVVSGSGAADGGR